MNWTELIDAVATRTGRSPDEVRDVLNATIATATERLSGGEDVLLRGLGSLSSRWQGARTLRSIQTKRRIMLDGRFVPRFRPSRRLREALASRTPQMWRSPEHQAAWRVAEALVSDLALYHAKRSPQSLTENTPPEKVRSACLESFGPLWKQVEQTYASRVEAAVRAEGDYLGLAARRAFATPNPNPQP